MLLKTDKVDLVSFGWISREQCVHLARRIVLVNSSLFQGRIKHHFVMGDVTDQTEPNRIESNRTGPNRTEQNHAEPNRTHVTLRVIEE